MCLCSEIKHSLRKSLPQGICLFVKDPQRDYKPLMEKVPEITKVIGISKLGAKYKSFEAKRTLCASYDFFLADARIIPMRPKKLGKTFFLKKKQPIAVELDSDSKAILAGAKKSIASLESAIHKQTHMFDSMGTCMSIKIGTTNMTESQIKENVMEALPQIISKIPGKWENIQNLNLKTGNSTSLPIFNSPIEVILNALKGN